MEFEDYIFDALQIVSAWELPDDQLAEAANAQAKLMAGLASDEDWEDYPATA